MQSTDNNKSAKNAKQQEARNFLHFCIDNNFVPHAFDTQLFHYTDKSGITGILTSGELLFSSPKSFNDPFDLSLSLLDYSMTKQETKNWARTLPVSGNRNERRQKEREFVDRQSRKIINNIFVQQRDNFGIFCVSEINNSTLMWSHYARKHTGFCLGFKFPNFNFYESMLAFKVKYTEEFTRMKFIPRDLKSSLPLIHWLYTKSKAWEYENEVRIVNLETNGFGKFDKQNLNAIYFGLATPREEIVEIKKLSKDNGYNIEQFYKMEMAPGSFNLISKPIK